MNSYLERLRQELESTIRPLSSEIMERAPVGKWSAAQIAEHLFLTYKGTAAGLAKCLLQGPIAKRPTFKDRMATMLVVGLGYMPSGRKSPERAMPQGASFDDVRKDLFVELQKVSAALDDCERRFGRRTKVMDHPIIGPLTADEWRKFHFVHGRHHLRQIRKRTKKV